MSLSLVMQYKPSSSVQGAGYIYIYIVGLDDWVCQLFAQQICITSNKVGLVLPVTT